MVDQDEISFVHRMFDAGSLSVTDAIVYLRNCGMTEREAIRTVERWTDKLHEEDR